MSPIKKVMPRRIVRNLHTVGAYLKKQDKAICIFQPRRELLLLCNRVGCALSSFSEEPPHDENEESDTEEKNNAENSAEKRRAKTSAPDLQASLI